MKKNVLIIDDCNEMRLLLKCLLEAKGYHIECSSNGEEAMTRLVSLAALPDVIFLDLQMPVMDGLSFLNMRDAHPRLKNIPVVLMSGEEGVETAGTLLNVTDVLKKPFSLASVVQVAKRNTLLH